MKVTIEKKTDQLNYEDFLGGVVRVVTVAGVKKGTKEQQYDIAIEGDKRSWRPPATVLKLLVEAWGDDATAWVGHRAELYGDPDVDFGPQKKIGGIRVSRVSHIDGPLSRLLTVTRGQKRLFKLDPLPDASTDTPAPTEPTAEQVAACIDLAELKAMWDRATSDERREQIRQRKADLENEPDRDGAA